MIIGSGMIAKRFESWDDPNTIIFASGVSNSKTTDKAEFERERELMYATLEKYPDAKIVYFSTCSIYDPSVNKSLYVAHKLSMETLIQSIADKYLIIRTTNLVGRSDSPHMIMNFLTTKIRNGTQFECWTKAVRNILDIDNFYDFVVENIAQENKVLNVFNANSYPVVGIIRAIERHYKRRAITKEIDKGSDFVIKGIGLKMEGGDYLGFLLNKYYPVYATTK